jgi:hypothetical protein
VCVQIIAEDYYRIDETLAAFAESFGGNPYNHDEYNIANELKEAASNREF